MNVNGDGEGEGVTVGLGLGVGVGAIVAVGVAVAVDVAVADAVAVGVAVAVAVAVAVGEGVTPDFRNENGICGCGLTAIRVDSANALPDVRKNRQSRTRFIVKTCSERRCHTWSNRCDKR